MTEPPRLPKILCIFLVEELFQIHALQIFSPSMWLLFNFNESQFINLVFLYTVFLVLYLRNHWPTRGHKDLLCFPLEVSLLFFRYVLLLHLGLQSILCIILYMIQDVKQISYLAWGYKIVPASFAEKNYFFHWISFLPLSKMNCLHICRNVLAPWSVPLIYLSAFTSIPPCLYYCGIGIVLMILGTLYLHLNFRISLSMS